MDTLKRCGTRGMYRRSNNVECSRNRSGKSIMWSLSLKISKLDKFHVRLHRRCFSASSTSSSDPSSAFKGQFFCWPSVGPFAVSKQNSWEAFKGTSGMICLTKHLRTTLKLIFKEPIQPHGPTMFDFELFLMLNSIWCCYDHHAEWISWSFQVKYARIDSFAYQTSLLRFDSHNQSQKSNRSNWTIRYSPLDDIYQREMRKAERTWLGGSDKASDYVYAPPDVEKHYATNSN